MKRHRMQWLCLLALPCVALGARADSVKPARNAERFEALAGATLTEAGGSSLIENLSFRVNCLAPSNGSRIAYGVNRGCGTHIDDILVIDTTPGIIAIVNGNGTTPVPEPSAFLLLAVGLIGALQARQVISRKG